MLFTKLLFNFYKCYLHYVKRLCNSNMYIFCVKTRYIKWIKLKLKLSPKRLEKSASYPVFKGKGDSDYPTNHEHISIVSHVAKLFENMIKSQIVGYLNIN